MEYIVKTLTCFISAQVSVLQRSRTNKMFICTEMIYFMELAHTVVEALKSKICRVGQQAGELVLHFKS